MSLQKITALAKKIRKQHPSKKWTDCIKSASKQLKSSSHTKKKVGAKKTASKLPVKKIVTTVTKEKIGGIKSNNVAAELALLESKIANKIAARKAARLMAEKKIINLQINMLRRQLKALHVYAKTIKVHSKK